MTECDLKWTPIGHQNSLSPLWEIQSPIVLEKEGINFVGKLTRVPPDKRFAVNTIYSSMVMFHSRENLYMQDRERP
jgi:hypothetical protein